MESGVNDLMVVGPSEGAVGSQVLQGASHGLQGISQGFLLGTCAAHLRRWRSRPSGPAIPSCTKTTRQPRIVSEQTKRRITVTPQQGLALAPTGAAIAVTLLS